MYVPDIEMHEASSLEEAASLLTRYAPDVRLLAGGTDLLVDLKSGRLSVNHVVSISRLASLRGVVEDGGGGLRIGALTTPNQLAAFASPRVRFSALCDATRDMAAPQVRNMATVGGNIASAVPSADLPPILMVMHATVKLWSPRGVRTVALEDFFRGPRQTVRGEDEVLTCIAVPSPPVGFGAAYARFSLRAANSCAVAGVAAGVSLDENEEIGDARLALCAVAPTPCLVPAAAGVLIGQRAGDEAYEAAAGAAMEASKPISDLRGSAGYRREVVGVLAQRALKKAVERARGART